MFGKRRAAGRKTTVARSRSTVARELAAWRARRRLRELRQTRAGLDPKTTCRARHNGHRCTLHRQHKGTHYDSLADVRWR